MHRLREDAGMTQAAVAAAIGVDPSLISRIERGSRPASDRILGYYAERFGSEDQLVAYVRIARGACAHRQRLRDPDLIARQDQYPLPGDKTEFVTERPPDGIRIGLGETFTKSWTIRNIGSVPWIDRRLRRIGPNTGPWILSSPVHVPIADTHPGEKVTITVELRAPNVSAVSIAQWKMVDPEDLLCFPTQYTVGLGVHVLIGPTTTT